MSIYRKFRYDISKIRYFATRYIGTFDTVYRKFEISIRGISELLIPYPTLKSKPLLWPGMKFDISIYRNLRYDIQHLYAYHCCRELYPRLYPRVNVKRHFYYRPKKGGVRCFTFWTVHRFPLERDLQSSRYFRADVFS